MKPKIWMFKMMLLFMFMLNGCAFLGIDLTETRTIAIQKDPYVIVLDGDLEHKDLEAAKEILIFLSSQRFQKADNSNFKVNVTDQTIITKGTRMNTVNLKDDEVVSNPAQVME